MATQKAKILFLDIETSPNLGWVWGKWEQDVIDFEKQSHLLSFSYKWQGEKKVKTRALPDFKAYKKDKESDKDLAAELWNLLDDADIVIAHNGDQFDIPKAQTRFIANGFQHPPSTFKTVDTKKLAKRYFKFESNSLNDLGKYLKLGQKLTHSGFKLWQGCMAGDLKAWKKMKEYNAQDVILLEQIYLALRPWMTAHPNVAVIEGKEDGCPACGLQKLQKRGMTVAQNSLRQRFHCQGCGVWTTALVKKV